MDYALTEEVLPADAPPSASYWLPPTLAKMGGMPNRRSRLCCVASRKEDSDSERVRTAHIIGVTPAAQQQRRMNQRCETQGNEEAYRKPSA